MQVIAINHLHGHKAEGHLLRQPSVVQRHLQQRLLQNADRFVGRVGQHDTMKVEAWPKHLKEHRVGYDGHVSSTARKLTGSELEPGLPPAGFAGKHQATELSSPEVKEVLLHPECFIKDKAGWPEKLVPGRIMCKPGEWEPICQRLYDMNIDD